MPPKKKGRKKEKPPLSVQGLLHLEASFVSPTDSGVTLTTVTPGSCYGYGDGAGHVPEQEPEPAEVGPEPGAHGDSPAAAADPSQQVVGPLSQPGQQSAEQPPPAAGDTLQGCPTTTGPPQGCPTTDGPLQGCPTTAGPPQGYPTNGMLLPPPPDMDDPDMYEPPEFAKETTAAETVADQTPLDNAESDGAPLENGLEAASVQATDGAAGENAVNGMISSLADEVPAAATARVSSPSVPTEQTVTGCVSDPTPDGTASGTDGPAAAQLTEQVPNEATEQAPQSAQTALAGGGAPAPVTTVTAAAAAVTTVAAAAAAVTTVAAAAAAVTTVTAAAAPVTTVTTAAAAVTTVTTAAAPVHRDVSAAPAVEPVPSADPASSWPAAAVISSSGPDVSQAAATTADWSAAGGDPAAAGWGGAAPAAAGQQDSAQLVAAAAAAADPAGHWSSGAARPVLESAAMVTETLPEEFAPADGLLQHYWQFVRENQYDFNGWTYLLQHVEKQTNLDAIRAVYNAFLPLYPYCYAYWKKYSDLEQRSGYTERSLQILERAVKAIPLSVELWMALLNQLRDHVRGQKTAQQQTRELCERAVRSAGCQFRSDALWECFIQWETANGSLSGVTDIYRRLLKIPTRLYNRHWDNFLQHVRDFHPRDVLQRDEYLTLRRRCCTELNMPYREEPAFELPQPSKTQKPEVKLISAIKEKIVAQMVGFHEETERKAEKRWKLEEKIKRPYFHVIPLDRRQLRTWRDYLELEAADGDHNSLVLLYERCLIACAQYEEFWLQYARYLERRLAAATPPAPAGSPAASATPAAPATTPASSAAAAPGADDDASVQRLLEVDRSGRTDAAFETESRRLPEERPHVAAGYAPRDDPVDAVREVYKRACLVHCPTKPNVRMQWAAFEESVGHAGTAVQLLGQVLASFPAAVRPWLQLIGLERRRQDLAECSRLYAAATDAAPDKLRTWWAMKHARFCFKVLNKPDKALGILRTAVKRDRSNPRLYLHILDVCYQRHPVDVRGVTAALTLALSSKDLSARDKLGFRRKRVEFFEEFGSLSQLRTAEDELENVERELAAAERKQARQQEKEQEKEQQEQQEEQEQARAGAKRRSKVKMDPTPPPPVPDENEAATAGAATEPQVIPACPKCGWDGSADTQPVPTAAPAPAAEPPIAYGQVPPTWDLTMSTQTYGYGKDPQYKWFQERGYREYAAREAGGYPASVLDPVSSDEESLGPAQPPPAKKRALLPNPDMSGLIMTRDGRRVPKYVIKPQAPPLRLPTRPVTQQMVQQPTDAPGRQEPHKIPQLARLPAPPPQLARLPAPPPQESDSPCVNVPEWLIREGGELLLSETENGMSRIRYWPHFMSDKGIQRMFHTLRRYVKWHQTRQVAADGRFVALKRLVAWFGPCGLEECGLMMPANDSWSPELLDLLERLCQFTGQEFNSCHLSLFRSGHDVHEWHGHDQPALGRQPTIALVSLGAIRNFELRQKSGGVARFLRFPLFPGSLLVMEGAIQQDWLHQVPREPRVKEERIGLQFRVMYDLKDAAGGVRPRLREPRP